MQHNGATQPIVIPPLTPEEEEEVIHVRLGNDERPIRRVVKKFYTYTSLAHISHANSDALASTEEDVQKLEEAQEALLVELAQFRLILKKSATVCDAEARQVEEYKKEKQRIEDEHGTLRQQIEELKDALEQAQLVRKRKIEYDVIAERINALPDREELERSIQSLDNDMSAIRAEHETQNRTIHSQKAALDVVIGDLNTLRLMGKETDSNAAADEETQAAEEASSSEPSATQDVTTATGTPVADGAKTSRAVPEAVKMDVVDESQVHSQLTEEDGDIEMGEVAEEPKLKRKVREDLEEGEASDGGSDS
ncbi:Tho complex subunit 7-domain-containing protein [Pterulicium gracile]|uniref:Tho complex subunit 7-domain-containing protein n=1 Tax=Pterulicium gracile TaxID=1884261 RepID=A0A5C3QVC3_9AGAR|nr:Tho complex subunit 7-domain-containing protein [Pterula gracilis]